MLQTSENNDVINDIVEEAQKLSIIEQQEFLIKMRLSNYLKRKNWPIANFDIKKIKQPTLEQIDNWKHESRGEK